ncbi:calcium-activated potassium channel subunit beta-2-like [Branchiostoma lanceolatum]|uniref:calcium-activated potassium channel subunit beta-2-like n=1 Tax=Branchiostoma lanceolatum TaxID=7740 RepID=UPI0034548B07
MSDERSKTIAKFNMYRCLVVLGMTLVACAAVAIIVCGVVIVKPVVETNSLEFEKTTCTTTKGYLTGKWIGCGCGKNCNSAYPCLRILVTHGGQDSGTYSGVMFENEQRLNGNGHLDEDSQCATQHCDQYRNKNMDTVTAFNDTYGAGETYGCLYHPDDTSKVIVKRLFTWDAMFHSMLWPCIAFFLFTVLAVFFCYQCYKAGKKMSSLPITVAPGAPAAQPGYFIPPQGGHAHAPYPQAMPMQQQDPYKTAYASDNKGYSYN